jgi:NTE family protein
MGTRNKIGCALGGGGARGLAHIGVLKVFEENGIRPDIITGTSIGAIIGALYASGLRAVEIERLVTQLDWKHSQIFADPALSLNGLIQGKRISALLESILGDLTFEDLVRDFTCVATDIQNGQPVLLRHGPLVPAIRASISIPGVFVPAKINGRYLVDGGLVLQVPANVCRDMGAEYVVGVNVVPDPARMMLNSSEEPENQANKMMAGDQILSDDTVLTPPETSPESMVSQRLSFQKAIARFLNRLSPENRALTENQKRASKVPTMLEVLVQCFTITGYRIAMEDLESADMILNPAVETVGFWQFDHAEEAIAAGERAARMMLEKNRSIFSHAYAPKLEID